MIDYQGKSYFFVYFYFWRLHASILFFNFASNFCMYTCFFCQNKGKALKVLRSRLYEMERARLHKDRSKLRSEQVKLHYYFVESYGPVITRLH